MSTYLNPEEIEKQAANPNITAQELDLLVSRTRDLTAIRAQELKKLQDLLTKLEQRLGISND